MADIGWIAELYHRLRRGKIGDKHCIMDHCPCTFCDAWKCRIKSSLPVRGRA